jgi:hypothetical protein
MIIMGKGVEASIGIMMAVVMGVITAVLVWTAINGRNPPSTSPIDTPDMTEGCNNDANCADNINGKKCMLTYPGDYTSFCGCIKDQDCPNGGDICGPNNKCV